MAIGLLLEKKGESLAELLYSSLHLTPKQASSMLGVLSKTSFREAFGLLLSWRFSEVELFAEFGLSREGVAVKTSKRDLAKLLFEEDMRSGTAAIPTSLTEDLSMKRRKLKEALFNNSSFVRLCYSSSELSTAVGAHFHALCQNMISNIESNPTLDNLVFEKISRFASIPSICILAHSEALISAFEILAKQGNSA